MNLQSLRPLLLAACVVASHCAHAAPSTVTASTSNFRYELIDLTPEDGSAPWISFSERQSSMTTAISMREPPYDAEQKSSRGFKELELRIDENLAWGETSLTGASSHASASDRSILSYISSDLQFVLAPFTEVRFWSDVSIVAAQDGDDEHASAAAGFSGEFRDEVLGVQSLHTYLYAGGTDSVNGSVTTGARTSGQQGSGQLYIFANSSAWAGVSPVPEPAHGTMLLGGLALVGAALWRRRPTALVPGAVAKAA